MTESLRILAFAGSLRKKSLNKALIRAAIESAPENVTMTAFDLIDLPMYNADVEAQGVPPSVKDFRRALAQADAYLIACPEYNFSVAGALKNALDWASRSYPDDPPPMTGKPAAIFGAGGRFGTVRAQLHLRSILLHEDLKVLGKPELAIPLARQHFDDDLNITNPEVQEKVAELVQALVAWSRLFVATG